MPPLKVDYIVSFSSEDPVYIANNILSLENNKAWKCRAPGEKQAIIVLQLEKASLITGIDIGNKNSAYVEILVSRSTNNDEYKVLLATSAFMTPVEARQNQNINKVRMFTREHFMKPECDEKWDRLKIVCTQPFNKHIQYGLSFIKLHSHSTTIGGSSVGKFSIRPESPTNFSAGSLFAKRKELKMNDKLTAAAAIRDAASSSTSLAEYASPKWKPKIQNKNLPSSPVTAASTDEEPIRKNRNRNELFYSDKDDIGSEKVEKVIKKNTEQKEEENKRKAEESDETNGKNKKKKLNEDSEKGKGSNLFGLKDVVKKNLPQKRETKKDSSQKKDIDGSKNLKDKPSTSKAANKTVSKKRKKSKPFYQLLEDVVIVISGIQNPERANLRIKALSMGAKYKGDWDSTCTHLICAFMNTPKFNQVKGKGKIITKHWIEKCHSERKRLPWRRFALDKNDMNQSESEEEIEEFVDQSNNKDDEHAAEGSDTEDRIAEILKNNTKVSSESNNQNEAVSSDDELDALNSTADNIRNGNHSRSRSSSSSTDIGENHDDSENKISIYDADTDEEPILSGPIRCPPNLFQNNKIYVDHIFEEKVRDNVCYCIMMYGGKLVEDVEEKVDFIVTTEENSGKMKKLKNGKCISQNWILECTSKKETLPVDDFLF